MLSKSARNLHRAADRARGAGPAVQPVGSFATFLGDMYQQSLASSGMPSPKLQAAPPGPSKLHVNAHSRPTSPTPRRKRQRQEPSRNTVDTVKMEYDSPIVHPDNNNLPGTLPLVEQQPLVQDNVEQDSEGVNGIEDDEAHRDGEEGQFATEETTSPLFGSEADENEIDEDAYSNDDVFVCTESCNNKPMLYVQTEIKLGPRRR